MRGVEPPRAEAHRHLKPARLPIPPHPRSEGDSMPDPGGPVKGFGGRNIKNSGSPERASASGRAGIGEEIR